MPNQLPSTGQVFLDHTAFFVPAMEGAADALEQGAVAPVVGVGGGVDRARSGEGQSSPPVGFAPTWPRRGTASSKVCV